MRISLEDIRSDFLGFSRLIKLEGLLYDVVLEDIEIDVSGVNFLEGNMCATLGSILYKAATNLNTVTIINVPKKVEDILSKNGFLGNYGRLQIQDLYKTTIPYKRFEPGDDKYFVSYINTYLAGKGIPEMTPALRRKFLVSIFEIFSNSVIHSETKLGIYSCGQFFPKKHRLDFSIADLGIGIRKNIVKKKGLDLSAVRAIIWATEGSNTTKTGSIPGGHGLKLLQDFVKLNKGKIQIVSDAGYWEMSDGDVTTQSFSEPFPGTVVNLEIKTSDENSYCLENEISPDEIF